MTLTKKSRRPSPVAQALKGLDTWFKKYGALDTCHCCQALDRLVGRPLRKALGK
jgi:hypothetical protein